MKPIWNVQNNQVKRLQMCSCGNATQEHIGRKKKSIVKCDMNTLEKYKHRKKQSTTKHFEEKKLLMMKLVSTQMKKLHL